MAFHETIAPFMALLLALTTLASADQCLSPTVTHTFHTSNEASTASETVFIVSFDLTCKNEASKPNVYAVLVSADGKTLSGVRQAAKTAASSGYQVSFSGEHAQLPKGAYSVRLYDEDGFAALKKAQRQEGGGEEAAAAEAAVESLAQLDIHHGGVWKDEMIRGEALALALAFVAFYAAHSAKGKIHEE